MDGALPRFEFDGSLDGGQAAFEPLLPMDFDPVVMFGDEVLFDNEPGMDDEFVRWLQVCLPKRCSPCHCSLASPQSAPLHYEKQACLPSS